MKELTEITKQTNNTKNDAINLIPVFTWAEYSIGGTN